MTLLFRITASLMVAFMISDVAYADSFWDASNEDNSASIDHSAWTKVLQASVSQDDGINWVDYELIESDHKPLLDEYIQLLISIDPREYSKVEQFAYWVNLYNALTVQLVVENLPVDSIKDIKPGLLSFTGPWTHDLITIEGQELSLDDIEHGILRKLWDEPRVHFAVNCASIGCPNLQAKAFTSDNTQDLLSLGAKEYVEHPRGVRFDEDGTLWLSSIFNWFKEDFGDSKQERLELIASYMSGDQAELAKHQGRIEYHYDWDLNGVN